MLEIKGRPREQLPKSQPGRFPSARKTPADIHGLKDGLEGTLEPVGQWTGETLCFLQWFCFGLKGEVAAWRRGVAWKHLGEL